MTIAIIGGSIAGCTAAFALGRAGFDIQLFERSMEPLIGRGASLVLAWPLFETCRGAGLLDSSLPFTEATSLDYFCRGSSSDERRLGSASLRGAAMHWSDLYAALRAHVPDDRFHLGATVVRQAPAGDKVEIGFADNSTAVFDAVIYADGYRSFGRGLVDPQAQTSFGEAVLVRGVTAEEPVDNRLDGNAARFLYPGGHGICYLIPGEDGSTEAGRRRVSCNFFLRTQDRYGLAEAVRDLREDGRPMTLDSLFSNGSDQLRRLLDRGLPAYFSDLLRRTSNFYVQPIFSIDVGSHLRERSCLIGDAGCVFPPYSNSGVLKAMSNTFSLVEALRKGPSMLDALSSWDGAQREMDRKIAADAERAGQMLIYDVPDLAMMSDEEVGAYLAALHPGFDVTPRN